MSDIKISAKDVKKLRDKTGAGMMDCKKALVEADGDYDKAIAYLRKKGQKVSEKRAGREAKEGVVIAMVSDDKKRGVIVKLSSETDFVAKNEDFINLTKKFAEIALSNFPATKDELLGLSFGDITVADKVTDQVAIIGEKIELAAYERLEGAQIAPYIHMGNKAAVLVNLTVAGDAAYEAGRNVAMQVAAMRPIAVDKDGIDPSVIEQEIEIGKEQARREGKPEQIIEKIALGKLNKFFKERTLLNQMYVKDNKKTIADYLNSVEKGLSVTAFKHVELG